MLGEHPEVHPATISHLTESLWEASGSYRFRIYSHKGTSQVLATASFMLPFLLLAIAAAGCDDSLAPALAALRQNDPAKAKLVLAPLQKQCSESSSYYELVGAANGMSGDSAAAEGCLQNRRFSGAQIVAAAGPSWVLLTCATKPQQAAAALARAVALDPSNEAATKYLLASYIELKDWSPAYALFEQMGVEKQPGLCVILSWFVVGADADEDRPYPPD